MDPLARMAVPFLILAAAGEPALAQAPYGAGPQYGPPYVYAAPPGWGLGPGAAIGAGMGALAGGSVGSAVAGSVIGAAMGAMATTPPVYPTYPLTTYVPVAEYAAPPAYAAPVPRGSADAFIANWQSFMQPASRR